MNRGSPVPGHAVFECLRRFNEAPIHESGKCFDLGASEQKDPALQ